MKNKCKFIGLCSCLALIGTGNTAYGNSKSILNNLSDGLSAISKQAHPFVAPKPGTEFSMRIIKPDPSVDCKIIRVMPDPSIDYKIRIVGPKFPNSFVGSNARRKGGIIENRLRK